MDEIAREFLSEPSDESHECHVCGTEIPTERGAQPVEGQEYAVMRENDASQPYALTERYVHKGCLGKYLERSDG